MRLFSWSLLTVVFFVLFFSSGLAADKIEFLYLPENITLLQGEELSTRIVLENIHNETIEWVEVKFEVPAGIEIETSEGEITSISPGDRESFRFDIVIGNDTVNGSKEIKIWSESEGSSLNGKQIINLTVKEKSIGLTTTTTLNTTGETQTTIQATLTQTSQQNTTTTTIEEEIITFKSKIIMIIVSTVICLAVIIFIISRPNKGVAQVQHYE